jgi:hypothetical protein
MRNKPNFPKSQMFITLISTTNYSEKQTMDTWSKQTQSNPTCSEQTCLERSRKSRTTYPERTCPEHSRGSRRVCSELARPERGRRVEPALDSLGQKILRKYVKFT